MQPEADRSSAAWDSLLLTLGGPPAEGAGAIVQPHPQASEKIPVTVLGGFLGAGKTTLLCQLLEQASIEIVAIVNDIASLNVDATRVRSRNADTIQLENGCACCVLGNDLRETLEEIGNRARRPDAVVLETSGLSDPFGVAQTVANVETMTLDGIVTVVDALTFRERASDPVTAPLFERQLAAAHLIALTKTTTCEQVFDLRDEVGRLAAGRPVLLSDHGETGADVLLAAAQRGARLAMNTAGHPPDDFAVETLEWPEPIDARQFFELLDDLPATVYRLKGWVCLQETGAHAEPAAGFEVQAAGRHWRVARRDGSGSICQLVVIGRSSDCAFDGFLHRMRGLRRRSPKSAAPSPPIRS